MSSPVLDRRVVGGVHESEPEPLDVDAGVIEEARRRQRRRRLRGAAGALGAAGLVVAFAVHFNGGGAAAPRPLSVQLASSPTWLTGSPFQGRTGLRLIVAEGNSTVFDVNVDRDTARVVSGLPSLANAQLNLTSYQGGALAAITRQVCEFCAISETDFLVNRNGSARRIAAFAVAPAQSHRTVETAPIIGSTALWVLKWPHRGPCSLRLVPSPRPTITVPCGPLGPGNDTMSAIWRRRGGADELFDPWTGHVRERLRSIGALDPLHGDLALEASGPPTDLNELTLVNLATGHGRRLGWPSILHFGDRVLPEPNGPLVAIEFFDPAYAADPGYASSDASDVWVLDARTGRLTHVPGFPILEYFKTSGLAWTSDDRLVIAAQGGAATRSRSGSPDNPRCRSAASQRSSATTRSSPSPSDQGDPGAQPRGCSFA